MIERPTVSPYVAKQVMSLIGNFSKDGWSYVMMNEAYGWYPAAHPVSTIPNADTNLWHAEGDYGDPIDENTEWWALWE